jgi:cytochrome c oxidase cbb3-type subunit 3
MAGRSRRIAVLSVQEPFTMPWSRSMVLLAGAGLLAAMLCGPVQGHRTGNPIDAAWANPAARAQAIKAGAPLYLKHCAGCHGVDARGTSAAHTPDLTDGRWLFGGEDIDTFLIRPSDIAFTILHGIRSGDPQARNLALMPALGTGHSLDPDEVAAVAEYVLKLSGQPYDANKLAAGKETYEGEGGCYDCHAVQGWGDPAIGAADLTSPQTWLYGRDRAAIIATVTQGRVGISPAFAGKLTPGQVRDLSIYVLSRAKSRKYI